MLRQPKKSVEDYLLSKLFQTAHKSAFRTNKKKFLCPFKCTTKLVNSLQIARAFVAKLLLHFSVAFYGMRGRDRSDCDKGAGECARPVAISVLVPPKEHDCVIKTLCVMIIAVGDDLQRYCQLHCHSHTAQISEPPSSNVLLMKLVRTMKPVAKASGICTRNLLKFPTEIPSTKSGPRLNGASHSPKLSLSLPKEILIMRGINYHN